MIDWFNSIYTIIIETNPRLGVFNYIILVYNGSPCSTRRAGLGTKEKQEKEEGENKEYIAKSKLFKENDNQPISPKMTN